MAELCTAFKRIVPRYQFSTNQAAFIIEDLRDAPHQLPSGDFCYKGPGCGHNRKFDKLIKKQTFASPYGFSTRPKVCPQNKYCSSMDSCNNWAFKPY